MAALRNTSTAAAIVPTVRIAGFVPEMQEFASDHEQFIAEMHEKYPPHTEP